MKKYLSIFCLLTLAAAFGFNANAQSPTAIDNIIITNNSAVINNLAAIGPVETTKSAFMGNKDNLTKKAELELKQQAEAKGGNIVFVTTNDFINDPNSYFKKVHMVGVVYKQASFPNNSDPAASKQQVTSTGYSDSTKSIGNGLNLSITDCVGDPYAQTVTLFLLSQTRQISIKA